MVQGKRRSPGALTVVLALVLMNMLIPSSPHYPAKSEKEEGSECPM